MIIIILIITNHHSNIEETKRKKSRQNQLQNESKYRIIINYFSQVSAFSVLSPAISESPPSPP